MSSESLHTVAVTGASGFVGRHLVSRLLSDGCNVTAITRGGCRRPGVRDVALSYDNASAMKDTLAGTHVVVHLAARAHRLEEAGPADAQRQLEYDRANVQTACLVARAAQAAGVRRMVFVSSIGVNGNETHGKPFTEGETPAPVEPYARSKLAAEQAIADLLGVGPTDYVVLRPPLVYGPGCPGNFERLLRVVASAPVLPLGAVRARRTLIGVDNLVDALLTAARHPAVSRRTFVVADAEDVTVAELVRTLALGMGRPSHRVLPVPPSWLALAARALGKSKAWHKLSSELRVDASAFRDVTGWTPPVPTTAGLMATANWYRTAPRNPTLQEESVA